MAHGVTHIATLKKKKTIEKKLLRLAAHVIY